MKKVTPQVISLLMDGLIHPREEVEELIRSTVKPEQAVRYFQAYMRYSDGAIAKPLSEQVEAGTAKVVRQILTRLIDGKRVERIERGYRLTLEGLSTSVTKNSGGECLGFTMKEIRAKMRTGTYWVRLIPVNGEIKHG